MSGRFTRWPPASIGGVVTGRQGPVIPGVEVSAVHLETGMKTATRTNPAGFHSPGPLPIAGELVMAEPGGFRWRECKGIPLTAGQALELDIGLEPGTVRKSVTVTADAWLLDTHNSEAGQLIESQIIEDLPLGGRRAMNPIEITGAAQWVDCRDRAVPFTPKCAGFRAGGGSWI